MSSGDVPHVESRIENGVLVLTLNENPPSHQVLGTIVTQTGLNRVVVNLERLDSISDETFTGLIRLARTLREQDGRLCVCGVRPGALEIIRREVRLPGLFPTERELATAIAHVASG